MTMWLTEDDWALENGIKNTELDIMSDCLDKES